MSINVGGTKNLINALIEFNKYTKIIFASSVSVYGTHEGMEPPRKAADPIGGTDNHSTHKVECEFISKILGANGIGMLPDEAFGHKPYYTDWMDTEESQRLLQYQRFNTKAVSILQRVPGK